MSLPQQQFTFTSAWTPNGGLCDECSKLNLEQSFARAFALYEGARRGRNNRTLEVYRSDDPNGAPYLASFHYVASLGNRLSHTSLCKLCNFLRQTIPEPEKGTYKLLAICTSESYLFERPKKDRRGKLDKRPWGELEHNVFMAVVPEVPLIPKIGIPLRWFETELPKNGSIYRLIQQEKHLNRLARPRDVGPKANMNLLKHWLDYCKRSHVFCAPKKAAGATLPGFRAINCTKKPPIVEERPWSEPYVALSYVWGTSLEDWPQTILDAVEATKRLGEKYLWVDRLCIDQSNLEEKKLLISKMDAIYEGAEFTIVAAEGDARSGLPGVMKTRRKPQPRVELDEHNIDSANPANRPPEKCSEFELLGLTEKEYSETKRDPLWLDLHRFGLTSKVTFEMSDMIMFEKEEDLMKKYDISSEHLTAFQELGEGLGDFDVYMDKMKQLAQAMGIPMKELVPLLVQQMGIEAGDPSLTLKDIARAPITSSTRPEFPLPPGQIPGKTILISTMEDPRVTIRNSDWATRGWTYQEGVLSNRRLVFTSQQVYWECCGNTANESLLLLILNNSATSRMASFMLSGMFGGDLHRVPELQYGYSPSDINEVSKQIVTLDSHIRAFTSRNLTNESDSLNAFLGIAARYSTNNGLHLLLGMPVLAGLFANGKPGLQDTFALSLSAWTHTAQPVSKDSEMYVATCPRRKQFPSWTWTGWTGRADFSTTTIGEDDESRGIDDDALHVDFFKVMTSKDWVAGINRLWSAEMLLHATDGSETTLLAGHAPVVGTATDQTKTWLLTIQQPLVVKHMVLMPSAIQGEWRRLMGKRVEIHLSVPMTEKELTDGHKSEDLVTVLMFASTVPYVFNGTARFLILRKVTRTRWERIGRLAMTIEEWDLEKCKSTADMIANMPVKKFGSDIVLI